MTTASQAPRIDIGGRVLTIQQPWASAIIYGVPLPGGGTDVKDVENRSWPPPKYLTGDLSARLYIHAGADADKDAPDWAWPADRDSLPYRAVLGYVSLIDATHGWHPSRWADPGDWHWWLRNPVAFPVPVRMRGWQGLWTPRDTQQAEARQILGQVQKAA